MFCIQDRADYLSEIVETLDLDDDLKKEALAHIAAIKRGFNQQALASTWATDSPGPKHLSRENIQAVKMLSSAVRTKVSYPKLNKEEVNEIVEQVRELKGWLVEHQIAEADFIRQALIEGLARFEFRLTRLSWLGWGYAVQSLRDVIGAYMALERFGGVTSDPTAQAMHMKVGGLLQSVYQKVGVGKEAAERAEFLLKLYGAASLLWDRGGDLIKLISGPN